MKGKGSLWCLGVHSGFYSFLGQRMGSVWMGGRSGGNCFIFGLQYVKKRV